RVFYTWDRASGAECARLFPGITASSRSVSKDPTVNRTFFTTLLKYALAFGLLGYVVWQNWMPGSDRGLESVWNKHVVRGEPIHTGFLALAVAVLVTSLALTVVRWYLLVRAVGLSIRLTDAFRLGLVGFFFNTFLPGSIGGDVVK